MNVTEARAKAKALAADYCHPYAVVKGWWGYDAERYNTLIGESELVEIAYPPASDKERGKHNA